MDIKIFFDSLDQSDFEHIVDPNSWYCNIKTYFDQFPDWKSADIALIGSIETRGNKHNDGADKAALAIRKQLYKLKKGTGFYRIVDLGNIRGGAKLEDSYLRIKEVCEILIDEGIMPIIIGGTHDLDYGLYMAFEKFNKLISVLNVDAVLDLAGDENEGMYKHHTHKILVHEPNFLFNFTNLAYQSYLNDWEMLDVLEKLYFENYRLGQIRENMQEIEPVVRQAEMLSFDLGAIKMQDAPGTPFSRPFGLSGEDACQLCWYAGLNERLHAVGLFEYNPLLDNNNQTASVVATMIWYLAEGFYNRQYESDFKGDNYIKYVVSIAGQPNDLNFYKSRKSEKWWMEVPFPQGKDQFTTVSIVPCSYNDYVTATTGELPTRWITMHAKLI